VHVHCDGIRALVGLFPDVLVSELLV